MQTVFSSQLQSLISLVGFENGTVTHRPSASEAGWADVQHL